MTPSKYIVDYLGNSCCRRKSYADRKTRELSFVDRAILIIPRVSFFLENLHNLGVVVSLHLHTLGAGRLKLTFETPRA